MLVEKYIECRDLFETMEYFLDRRNIISKLYEYCKIIDIHTASQPDKAHDVKFAISENDSAKISGHISY